MANMEHASDTKPRSRVERTPEGLCVHGDTYSLEFQSDCPYVNLTDASNRRWAELSLASSLDTIATPDATLHYDAPVHEQTADGTDIIRISSTSTTWQTKELVITCHADSIELYVDVTGDQTLANCHMLGGDVTDGNHTGYFPSKIHFKSIFNPQPDNTERRDIAASESTVISTHGMWLPGRAREFAVPTQWCYAASMQPSDAQGALATGQRLMLGVATPIDQQNFTQVGYSAQADGFSLDINYEGQTAVHGPFRTPSLLLHFADDPYQGLVDYAAHARSAGLLERLTPPARHSWHAQPMFCSWGEQTDLAARQTTAGNIKRAQDFATQADYDEMLDHLAAHNVSPPTLVIDDKWQQEYGTNTPDTAKWPNMQQWIARQHTLGRKVLLWWKLGAFEGIDPSLCIVDRGGRPVSTDPSNPEYLRLLRAQVNNLLSADGLDADGLKVDFLAQSPTGLTLQKHGKQWGAAALHTHLKAIYTQAKATKADSLIINHAPNPWFIDTADMIRLNDINNDSDIVATMQHRQRVAAAASANLTEGNLLIDTDNWPLKSLEQWRTYASIQPQLGVVALYNARGIGSQAFTERDYALMRRNGLGPPVIHQTRPH